MYYIIKHDIRKEQSTCIESDMDINIIREMFARIIQNFIKEKNTDPDSIPLHVMYNQNFHTCYVYRKKEVINKGWIYNSYMYDTEKLYSYNITCLMPYKKPFNIRITPTSMVFNKDNLFKNKIKSVQLIDELKNYFKEHNIENKV